MGEGDRHVEDGFPRQAAAAAERFGERFATDKLVDEVGLIPLDPPAEAFGDRRVTKAFERIAFVVESGLGLGGPAEGGREELHGDGFFPVGVRPFPDVAAGRVVAELGVER